MVDLYELRIVACTSLGNAGNIYHLEHRFTDLPELATVKALKEEAAIGYISLFDDEAEVFQVMTVRLSNQEVMYATREARDVEKAYHDA